MFELKAKVDCGSADKIYDIDPGYFTARGAWYHKLWKGSKRKLRGITVSIGSNFFDMLGFIDDDVDEPYVHHCSADS